MNADQSRIALLQRVALFCAVLVITVVSISAFIRLSGAGLGCTPWPQCYGQSFRDQQDGLGQTTHLQLSKSIVVARFAHRLFAVLLLPLVLILVIGGFTMRPKPWEERWLALLAFTLVLFLAVLGVWTAGARVPAVTLGNLLGGFLLFALCWRMAGVGFDRAADVLSSPSTLVWKRVSVVVVLVQIVLGGLVSSGYAGLSCPDFSNCIAFGSGHWDALNPMREPRFDTGAVYINSAGTLVHGLHRWVSVATGLVVIALAITLLRAGQRRMGLALLVLIVSQFILGVLLVLNGLPLVIAVAHNAIAAMLLAALFATPTCRSTSGER